MSVYNGEVVQRHYQGQPRSPRKNAAAS